MSGGQNGSSQVVATFCMEIPTNVNSKGYFGAISPLRFPLTLLQLQMLVIFVFTQLVHFALKRLGLPKVVSEIIAGLILGPSVLGRIDGFALTLFPNDSQGTMCTLSLFGYTLFMFLIAVKMDVTMVTKTGKKALATGILALITPVLVGLISSRFFATSLKQEGKSTEYLDYLAAAHSMTSFPVVCCLLSELKLLNSELGRLALSSALIGDLFSVTVVSIGTMAQSGSFIIFAVDAISALAFIIGVIFIARPAMFWVIRHTPEGRPVRDEYIVIIILAALASGLVTNQFGLSMIFGSYIFGLVVPDGPPLGSTLVAKLDSFVTGFISPLYVTTCTFRADFSTIQFDSHQIVIDIILIIFIYSVKIIATMAAPLYCNVPFNDALTLTLITCSKGIVDMAVYSQLADKQIINQETFSVMTLSTLVAATVVPKLVHYLYDPSRKYASYQIRTIFHSRPDSEMRVLACIHRADSIAPMINILHAYCPSKESPLNVFVLHLIELIGRSSPLFISHQIQKRTVHSKCSYSENIILAFNKYEKNNLGAVSVQAFTAISPPELMHEDICTLALNKLTSLIVIPFDIKWGIDGSIVSEDRNVRTLINSVLNRAPCSVAILIDHGYLGHSTSIISSQSTYCAAMLFFGGKDDREALSMAKCMVRDPAVELTVVRFISTDNEGTTDWDKAMDSEVLKDIKFNINVDSRRSQQPNIKLMEEIVKDGPETALIVRSMVHDYDLIIVGRRHNVECPQTSGLVDWIEFPELGIIGDLLSSSDLNSKASVLVVQQQQQQLS